MYTFITLKTEGDTSCSIYTFTSCLYLEHPQQVQYSGLHLLGQGENVLHPGYDVVSNDRVVPDNPVTAKFVSLDIRTKPNQDIQVFHEQRASWGFNSHFTKSFQVSLSLLVNMKLLGLNFRFFQCCGSDFD